MFLSSQQGRLRVYDGHDATAPSLLTSEHDRALLVDKPRPLSAWACLDFFFYGDRAGRARHGDPELPAPSGPEVAKGVRERDGGGGGRPR